MADEKPKTVTAGDGREILITEANGPVNLDGTHANLEPAPEPAASEPAEAAESADAETETPEQAGEEAAPPASGRRARSSK